jgi:penicillin-binding protein 1A
MSDPKFTKTPDPSPDPETADPPWVRQAVEESRPPEARGAAAASKPPDPPPAEPAPGPGPEPAQSPPAPAPPPPAPAPEPEATEQVGEGLVLEKRGGGKGPGGKGPGGGGGGGKPPRKPKKKKSKLRRLVTWAAILLGVPAVLGGLGVAGMFWHYAQDPDIPAFRGLEDYRPSLVTDIYSGDDQLIGEFYVERRRTLPYHDLPKQLVQAFIAVEDGRFFDHFGVDPIGMLGAVWEWVRTRGRMRGASTLTQQTAKAILVSEWGFEAASERSVRRKVIEAILAFRLEQIFSKEEILEIYLNHVFLGHRAYGVQSAAENYFRKNVHDLTLAEMALLAGLPQAPSRFSPFVHPDRAISRRRHVLERMYREGMITEAERDRAAEEEVRVHPIEDVFRETAPFFTEHVRRDIVQRYGNSRLLHDGLSVYTTVDTEKQRSAQESMLSGLASVDKRQGYQGALYEVPKDQWDAFARKYDQDVLEGRALEVGQTYVALVTEVERHQVKVRVGRHEGVIPIAGMRWARRPNPDAYYPSALIDDARRALSAGEAILVKRVERAAFSSDRDPAALRRIPQGTSLFTLEQLPELQGALISMDPVSSYVVAMIGGLDFEYSEFNRAFQACRQPGSSFKPIVYAAAIENLEWTQSTILIDGPMVYDDPDHEVRWRPTNYGRDFAGDVTLRSALVRSINIPAVRAMQEVGIDETLEFAKRLGIRRELSPDLSTALGSSCVTPWELTNVFAVFPRDGRKMEPTFIRRVVDRDGNVLEDRTVYFDPWAPLRERIAAGHARLFEEAEQVMSATTAYLTTELLHHAVRHGTGIMATRLGKPAGGKTGTTNDSFDAWFVGFTKELVTGVWIGYDTYERPMARYENGGRAALPIWLSYMDKALDGRDQPAFAPAPEVAHEIVRVQIDVETGLLAAPGTTRPRVEASFVVGTEPTTAFGEIQSTETGSSDFFLHDSGL